MTREQLEAMSVTDLRRYAREHTSINKTRLVFLKKAELIEAILTPSAHETSLVSQKKPDDVVKGPDLADAIAVALQGRLTAEFDEGRVREIVAEAIDALREEISEIRGQQIEIKKPDGSIKPVGRQHYLFPQVLDIVSIGIPLMLVGPAGSGKTHVAEAVAEALDLRFYPQSVTAQTSLSTLMGYMDASGRYVSSPFRQAYEKGGLYLLDEVDAGNPNVLCALNSATANSSCLFPDGVLVRKHELFRLIAGANTYGRGANREYAGRNIIDGSTLDRFAVLDFPYDEALETEIAINKTWARRVQAIRAAVNHLPDVKHIVSPRASIYGGLLLNAGFDRSMVEEITIWKGLNAETRRRIESIVQDDGSEGFK